MRLKPYPKYKASGVEWLGEVPERWRRRRLRFAAALNPSKAEIAELDRNTEVSFLPMEAIGDDGSINLRQTKQVSEVDAGYTYFRNGDVAIAKITPCFENGKGARMVGLKGGVGFGTTELIVARPRENLDGDFLHWLFVSEPFRKQGEAYMYGAGGQKRVPDDFVRNFDMAWPPLDLQTAIAAFLDHETAKIDTLIAKQEKLIELLKEKRQAVISHAVTKGLDPTVPMRRSGVEWLGDVPAHWTVKRLKHISPSQVVGIVVNPSEYVVDDGFPFIYGGDIREGVIDTARSRRISADGNRRNPKSVLRAGDLLTVRVGAPGVTAVVSAELEGGNCASVMLTRRSDSFVSPWLCYAMNSRPVRFQVEVVQYGAAQEQFNIGHAIDFVFPVPPIEEQRKLTTFLDAETARIDALIAKARQAIALQKEHRTALISAAVTGKIDVRAEVAQREAA